MFYTNVFIVKNTILSTRKLYPSIIQYHLPLKFFHTSPSSQGFEEFSEVKKASELIITGRSWTAADLRRKVRLSYCKLTLY